MHYDCKRENLDKYEIEIEGKKVVSKRDPPGQKSVYIMPGTVTLFIKEELIPKLRKHIFFFFIIIDISKKIKNTNKLTIRITATIQ